MAPTVIRCFDLPVPRDMDGDVITDVFSEDNEAQHTTFVREDVSGITI